jgi:valyl-tRNA synthetase
VVEEITAEGLAVMTRPTIPPRQGAPQAAVAPKRREEGRRRPRAAGRNKPIMQPFGDRSKVVIEPMLTDQWFVDTEKIVGPASRRCATARSPSCPSRRKTYFHWLENIEPWCISRQLWWGHQIPVWYGFDLSRHGFRDDEGDGALDEVEMLRLLMAQTGLERRWNATIAPPISTPSQRQFMDSDRLPCRHR